LACRGDVAFDRGDAHAEGTGGFDLGHPPLYGLDDLLAQVFRVSIHPLMMTDSPATLQGALEGVNDYGEGQVFTVVAIFELRDGKVWRDTRYYAEPFEAPEWPAQLVERMES
jgi:hypothetical protein